jgi:hypothetical protein
MALPAASSNHAVINNDQFRGRFAGQPGNQYWIQASSNLIQWVNIGTNAADFFGGIDFLDPDFGVYPYRFYRLRPASNNDDFANRYSIDGTGVTVFGSNAGATKEPDEPNHAGNPGGKSVWWTWTAPSNGAITISTIGSDFDTTLAVYTGNALAGLVLVASDDDGGGNLTSRVSFGVMPNVTYQIAVDGFSGASGSIQLNITAQ